MKQKRRKKSPLEQKNNKNLEKRSIQMKIEQFADKYAKSQKKEWNNSKKLSQKAYQLLNQWSTIIITKE